MVGPTRRESSRVSSQLVAAMRAGRRTRTSIRRRSAVGRFAARSTTRTSETIESGEGVRPRRPVWPRPLRPVAMLGYSGRCAVPSHRSLSCSPPEPQWFRLPRLRRGRAPRWVAGSRRDGTRTHRPSARLGRSKTRATTAIRTTSPPTSRVRRRWRAPRTLGVLAVIDDLSVERSRPAPARRSIPSAGLPHQVLRQQPARELAREADLPEEQDRRPPAFVAHRCRGVVRLDAHQGRRIRGEHGHHRPAGRSSACSAHVCQLPDAKDLQRRRRPLYPRECRSHDRGTRPDAQGAGNRCGKHPAGPGPLSQPRHLDRDQLAFDYQWQRCDSAGAGCSRIPERRQRPTR